MDFLTDYTEFVEYVPEIVKLHQKNNHRFSTGMKDIDVASELFRVFKGLNYTVLETYPLGKEIKFFSCIELFQNKTAFWWMVYSHPRNREFTSSKMEEIADHLKSEGYLYIDSLTTRVTPSYKRWMKKLNFFQREVSYRRYLK